MGCELTRFAASQPHMGTKFTIVVYAPAKGPAKRAFEVAFARIAQLDQHSERLSRDERVEPLESVVADVETRCDQRATCATCSAQSQRVAARSKGAFDVTVGPLTKLWRRARRQRRLPTESRLAAARAAVGFRASLPGRGPAHGAAAETEHASRSRRHRQRLCRGSSLERASPIGPLPGAGRCRWRPGRRRSAARQAGLAHRHRTARTGAVHGRQPIARPAACQHGAAASPPATHDESSLRLGGRRPSRGRDVGRHVSVCHCRRCALLAHRRSQDRSGTDAAKQRHRGCR